MSNRLKFIKIGVGYDYKMSNDGSALIKTPLYRIEYEDENEEHQSGFHSSDLGYISKALIEHFSISSVKEEDDNAKTLYHCTTPKKAKKYHEMGAILKPVRGFTTLQAAMAWCIHTGRTVIYEVKGGPAYKLPDHHNKFGEAWWIDEDVPVDRIQAVRFDLPLHKCGKVNKETK